MGISGIVRSTCLLLPFAWTAMAAELPPVEIGKKATSTATPLGRYSDRTLAVGIEVDRDSTRLLSFTLKDRPFVHPVERPEPREYSPGRTVQVEYALLGPADLRLTLRADVGPLCLTHGPDSPPHVDGDTILVHRDAFRLDVPEIPDFDRIEVAFHERGRDGMVRRQLGRVLLDRSRYAPGFSGLAYEQLAIATTAPAENSTRQSAGIVRWPEEFQDPDIYRVYGNPSEGDRRINVVLVPDGYTYSSKALMEQHADALVAKFRSKTPFAEHDLLINYVLVYAYSSENGTDECDCGTIVDTAMGTRFPDPGTPCRDSSNRCLYYGNGCDTNSSANIVAAELRAPYHDETIVMVNTTRYGGCGGARAVYSAGNSSATEIGVHELGHSLAGLADEYAGTSGCGTWAGEVNTSLDGSSGAWPEWVAEIGTPREGAQYYDECVYRPQPSCEMRSLNQSFCSVCNQHWSLVYYGHWRVGPTAPIESVSPPAAAAAFVGIAKTFAVATRLASGVGVTHDIAWTVQGPDDPEPLSAGEGTESVELTFDSVGTHTVTCRVTADTNFVKPSKNGSNTDTAVWTVDVTALALPPEISPPGSAQPVRFDDRHTLSWENAIDAGASGYNVYRGGLANLVGGDFGTCLVAGVETNVATLPDDPAPGGGWTYLVSGLNEVGEGPLGQDSAGLARIAAAACP